MNTVKQINDAIERADKLQSKVITHPAWKVPALASLRIRCLLNNLGENAENYLECGVHRSGSFSSAVAYNDNIKNAYAVDSWASDHMGGEANEVDFRKNSKAHVSWSTDLHIIKSDCFKTDLSLFKHSIDFYLYDAGHSMEDQRQALTYFYPVLTDTFLFCVDDYDLPEVQEGTRKGIADCNLDILFERHLVGNDHDNDGWWRGYAIFLLKKNK